MKQGLLFDTSQLEDEPDVTTNKEWLREQSDRLLNWEVFYRHVTGQCSTEMPVKELCDKIGVRDRRLVHKIIEHCKQNLNVQSER